MYTLSCDLIKFDIKFYLECFQERPKGRSYINVVDLDASAVLHDLGKLPEKEEQVGDDLGPAPQSVTMTTAQGRNLEELEESMRDALRPTQPSVERPFKQDSVTVRMFESHLPHHNRLDIVSLISLAGFCMCMMLHVSLYSLS